MSREFEQRAIEHALQLRTGMPEAEASKLNAYNEEQNDWYAFCQQCEARLEGTLKQMREHRCA